MIEHYPCKDDFVMAHKLAWTVFAASDDERNNGHLLNVGVRFLLYTKLVYVLG